MTRQYTTPQETGIMATQAQTVSIGMSFQFDPDPAPGNGSKFMNGSFTAQFKVFDADGNPDPAQDMKGLIASIDVASMPPQERTRVNQLIQYAEELAASLNVLPAGTSTGPV